jgi:DeoR/GlpR family transcriptional regulator of sugar metabolism
LTNAALSSYERRDLLLRYIEQSRRVSVNTICERFQISEATARRDLGALAEQAKIRRVHGGAIAVAQAPQELPVYQRMAELADAKQRIGAKAAGLLRDGETVFLGSGTTVLEVARALTDGRDLTVITNSLLVLNELIDRPSISVICLGGQFRRSELSMIGHMTEQALADLRTDKVIIGIHAISVDDGLSNRHLAETMTDRRILQAGRQVIVVADHTKLGRISTVSVAPLSTVDTLITDRDAPPDAVRALEQRDVRVLLA